LSSCPIGIFDSGVGGISIWKEICSLLPFEDTVYLADSKNAPYGPKTKQEIIDLSIKNTEYLLSKKCKLIVVACNTATTNAIKILRDNFTVPFIGIEPAIKPASLQTKTNTIGVLATKGTLGSSLFCKTSERFAKHIHVIEQEGDGIVELIEEGKLETEAMMQLLKHYIDPMIQNHIDHLVLGCTHYTYLIPLLKKILPDNVIVITSGPPLAKQVKTVLEREKLLRLSKSQPQHEFFTNGDTKVIKSILGFGNTVTYTNF